MLKFYVPNGWRSEMLSHIPLLYPFWGVIQKDSALFNKNKESIQFDKSYYSITENLRDADLLLIPHNYWNLKKNSPQLLTRILNDLKGFNKPVLVDAYGDTMDEVDIPNSIVLRFAQYRDRLKENDIIVPAYIEDLGQSYGAEPIEYSPIPSVGFVGWATLPFWKHIKTYIKEIPIYLLTKIFKKTGIYRKGVFLRGEIIKILKNSNKIKSNFIIRESFSGHKDTVSADPAKLREEFIENIINSNYSLCLKGDANQSTRFYEVLSLGRIPFYVDTDTVLPLEDKIDYKNFCVFIDYKDIRQAPDKLYKINKILDPKKYLKMQGMARDAYNKYLRIDSFTKYLMDEIKEKFVRNAKKH